MLWDTDSEYRILLLCTLWMQYTESVSKQTVFILSCMTRLAQYPTRTNLPSTIRKRLSQSCVQAETVFEATSTPTADNKAIYNSTGSPVFASKARTYPPLRIGHGSNSLSPCKHSVQHRYGKHPPKSRANADQISWLAWFTNWAKSVCLCRLCLCRNISQMTSSPRTPYRPTIAGVLPFSVWLRGNSAPSCIIFVFVYYLL